MLSEAKREIVGIKADIGGARQLMEVQKIDTVRTATEAQLEVGEHFSVEEIAP